MEMATPAVVARVAAEWAAVTGKERGMAREAVKAKAVTVGRNRVE